MLERRWVKARVGWQCPACSARAQLRADDDLAAPTCEACSKKLDLGSAGKAGILEAIAGGTSGAFFGCDVESHPFTPTCPKCTAWLDTRWTPSGCVMRCAPCGREYVIGLPVQHPELHAFGESPRDPLEIWACFEGDLALANPHDDDTHAEPSAVLWPLLWLGVIASASVALIIARLLW